MEADYDIFEIVAVIRGFWLIDAESYQRKYCTDHGEPLTPGYYIVNWPEHIRARRFNNHAAFYGPFKLRKEANIALSCMHNEREHIIDRSYEILPAAGHNASSTEMKKTGSQRIRQDKEKKSKNAVYVQ